MASKKQSADYLILKRRAAEEERRRYEDLCKYNFKAETNAEWEIKTAGFIEHQKTKQRYESIRSTDEAAVDARRRKLAEFLAAEQAMFQQQLESMDETAEQRKARMEARASELKEKRESERLDYVRQQYERQWRMACDPLREQESKAILRATNAARAYQIGEKMKQLEIDEQEERAFDEMWEADRLSKLGREEREEDARQQMDAEHKAVLDQQVGELHAYREQERKMGSDEAALLRKQWELEREEAKRVESMRHKVLVDAQNELHQFNKHKRAELTRSVAEERATDLARLNAQLAREQAEEDREAATRAAMQEETKKFTESMMAQKRKIADKEAEMEELRKAELDKAWDKRLQVWGAEQEAREKLMAQVLNERKMQVVTKLEQEKIDKITEAEARVKLDEELARINAIENEKLIEARSVRMQHRALLENQMKSKAFARTAAQFNKTQERMAAERAEAQYQAMLADQMSKTSAQVSKFSG